MTKKIVRLLVLVVFLVGVYLAYPFVKLYFTATKTTINSKDAVIFIPTGSSLKEVVNILVINGVLEDSIAFNAVASYKNLNNSNIAAGKYIIEAHTTLKRLANGFFLNRLGNGNAEVPVQLTFNNCRDAYQLAEKVSKCIEADSLSLVNYFFQEKTIAHFGFTEPTFITLFIPDTYEIFWDCSAEEFIDRMAQEYKKFWTPQRKSEAKKQGLSQSETVTLASIVYKEQSVVKEEWPEIARLYLNRLQNNWKLESDPTFRYCWGDKLNGVQRLNYEHRAIDCPYNTYNITGLPPGPICIPPKGVVEAVLNPAQNDYFFMCAKPNGHGRHNFAHSYEQHLRNAHTYQQWMSKNGIR
jgi:UPF0755 protein